MITYKQLVVNSPNSYSGVLLTITEDNGTLVKCVVEVCDSKEVHTPYTINNINYKPKFNKRSIAIEDFIKTHNNTNITQRWINLMDTGFSHKRGEEFKYIGETFFKYWDNWNAESCRRTLITNLMVNINALTSAKQYKFDDDLIDIWHKDVLPIVKLLWALN